MSNDEADFAVGYAKPPRETRFQKGRSGNPAGRPRGAKNLTTVIGETLAERVAVTENGRRRKITKLAATCKQLVNKALSGDLRAMRLLLEFVRVIDARTESSAVEEPGLLEQADKEIMRELRVRLTRLALRPGPNGQGDVENGRSESE